MIGIICAMPEEFTGLLDSADECSQVDSSFTRVTIGAAEAIVSNAGLGKTRAAMTATTMIERFGCTGLVSAGTAGGLAGVEPFQVLIGTRLIQHDYGRSRGAGQIELYKPGVPPLPEFLNDDFAFELAPDTLVRYQAATSDFGYACFGTFASGDMFVNDAATRARLIELGANAVDMESGAIAQVAEFYGLPWLAAKGISDDASDISHEAFLHGLSEAARRSAEVVGALLPHMQK